MTGVRLPFWSTLIVLLAVATMIALGFWQLGRAEEKNALIAKYGASAQDDAVVRFPTSSHAAEDVLYRRSQVTCTQLLATRAVAGTSATGAKGWAQQATCRIAEGGEAVVALGFSRDPASPAWGGGEVTGIVAPGPRLVADPPAAGLEPLAKPDPNDLPNNHLAYAVQWFLFAATAIVIYALALRRRGSTTRA
ncbi:SURF1 family protein [Porphyrobacter sp. GA68]|uniref:SURF1 family protein n=1 Tax=Porphyrobacter sp. GA68 TaxID=2883480 RepID=UPI001D17D6D5|nr:SURF1 family protein [Porphyrobacter sp. GA68]